MKQQPEQSRSAGRTMTVIGTGKASAQPDLAEVQAGVVTQDSSAAKALEQNTAAVQTLMKTLAGRGIAEKDIQTSNFSVSPLYRHDPQGKAPPTVTGYQVSNQVRVKVRQLANLGSLLDELVRGGANQMGGISFSLAEPTALQDKAREDAVVDARRKAELYARAAGVKVVRVLRIQEQGTAVPVPGPQFMTMRASEAAVPVAPGEHEVHASVTITFAIGE